MWVLMVQMGVLVWMIGRLRGMRKSFCRVRRMRVVWVERLQFRMKWNEGGMENVWLWRVCSLLVGRVWKRMRNVVNPMSWVLQLSAVGRNNLKLFLISRVTKYSWRMCNGCMNNPLIWVCSRDHFCNRKVLLQKVEWDFAEVEVFSQLRIREENLSHILSHI